MNELVSWQCLWLVYLYRKMIRVNMFRFQPKFRSRVLINPLFLKPFSSLIMLRGT